MFDVGEYVFVYLFVFEDVMVVVVMSVGFQCLGDEIWFQGNQSFWQFGVFECDLMLSYVSNNFDCLGFVVDFNVVYFLD